MVFFSYLLRLVYMVTIHNDDVGTSQLQFMFGRGLSKASLKLRRPRGDVGVEYVLSTPLRVVRGD